MKPFLSIALLMFAAVVCAADRGPEDMVLTGPDSAKVGESIRLRLDGLPSVELAKTMNEQLSWMSKVRVITSAPKGVANSDYTLDQQLSIKVSPFQWTFALDFKANKPGDYIVIVDWNEGNFGLTFHRIVVGGSAVPPADPTLPPEDPNHPPNPSKIDRVTWVWEKDNGPVPRHVAAALQRINADRSAGVFASDFEDDTVDGDGQVPDQYKAALEASKTAGVPVLVFQSGSTVVKTMKDPKTEAEIMEALK